MGLATALELARRGERVVVYERDVVGNPLGASADRSKAFRFAYADPFYADLGRRSLELWRTAEADSGDSLLEQCGLLYLDVAGAEADAVDVALATIGAPHELLDDSAIARRFPGFTVPDGTRAAFDPSGGFVRADRAVSAFARLARDAGVDIREHDSVIDLFDELREGPVVLAAGPWSPRLHPGLPIRTTLQETVYARPRRSAPFVPGRFPVFIEAHSGYYGFPLHADGVVKLARHKRDLDHPALTKQAQASAEFVAQCRAFWRAFVPELADAPLASSRLCVYDNTPDEDFLIGRASSGVVLCTGFSGHGFKFAPIVGRLCAQIVCGEPTDVDVSRFAPARPLRFAR